MLTHAGDDGNVLRCISRVQKTEATTCRKVEVMLGACAALHNRASVLRFLLMCVKMVALEDTKQDYSVKLFYCTELQSQLSRDYQPITHTS